QWRAVRSDAMGPSEIHPYMIRDSNPLESLPFTRPAAVAGNPLSPGLALSETGSALLQYLADGPGHLTPVPPDLRRGRAAGIFREGSWHVTLDLDETDPSPAVLRPGMHGLVALAVWNGAAHDRNGQKTITPWVALEVEE
ncbi:MAG: hypothetical protein ACE5ID_05460, partial [Acidobacteriota bacterium]